MRKYILYSTAITFSSLINAQNASDILLQSNRYLLGTARSQGAAGAFGSLGADFSAAAINPAGFALYRRNEAHFSMAVTSNTANATFLNNEYSDSRTNFNIPSFGIVLTKINTGLKGDATTGIVNFNFAFGYNRTNHYQQNIYMDGYNTSNHISTMYVEQSNGIPSNQINGPGTDFNLSRLGWDAYLTDTFNNNSTYYSPWFEGANSFKILQQQKITRRGGSGEYNFMGSINLADYLYFGGGLVWQHINREEGTTFIESDPNSTIRSNLYPQYQYLSSQHVSNLNTTGGGISGRFGMIFRPLNFIRVGLAVQTKSRLNLTDEFSYNVQSSIKGFGDFSAQTPLGQSEYTVITPAKYTASASFIVKKLGFISADLDVTDFSKARLTPETDPQFSDANQFAANQFGKAIQMRMGGELRLFEDYRFRAGYAFSTSPYAAQPNDKLIRMVREVYSVGAGYNAGHYFIDYAITLTTFKENFSPYQLANGTQPVGIIKNNQFNFVVSGGYRF